jgi:micrococcal nuclease
MRAFCTFRSIIPIFFLLAAGCGAGTGSPRTDGLETGSAVTAANSTVRTVTISYGKSPTPGSCVRADAPRVQAVVTYVTDGDSIGVEVGGVPFRVRYIGIDAPELAAGDPGEDAAEANRALVEGKTIEMVRDLSEADRYGRLLRYVFADGVFVNYELVRSGRAWAGFYPPDTACTAEFRAAEEAARLERLGLWGWTGSPTFLTRTGPGCAGGCVTPPPGCLIKGNINAEGEKIYHVPGGKYYEQTVIDPEKGERWFCSEAEAVAAGWRKSKV